MRSFLSSSKANEYRPLRRQMNHLVAEFGADSVHRALCELESEKLKEAWATKHGLKQSSGSTCFTRLLGRRCPYQTYFRTDSQHNHSCRLPGCDHDSLWLFKGAPVVLVYQPYQLGKNTVLELSKACERHGLDWDVSSFPAWHFPGAVLHVEIYPKNGIFHQLQMGTLLATKESE